TLPSPEDDRLVPDLVADSDRSAHDARQRPRAAVLHEPLRPTDRRGAVLALRAKRALAIAPEMALLRLARGGRARPPAAARRQRVGERELGDAGALADLELTLVELRRLRGRAGLGDRAELHGPVDGVDRRPHRNALRALQVDVLLGAGQPDPDLPAHD